MIHRRSSGVMTCRVALMGWAVVVVVVWSGCWSERDAMAVLQLNVSGFLSGLRRGRLAPEDQALGGG